MFGNFLRKFEKSLKFKINLVFCWVTKKQLCMDCTVFRLKFQWGNFNVESNSVVNHGIIKTGGIPHVFLGNNGQNLSLYLERSHPCSSTVFKCLQMKLQPKGPREQKKKNPQ